MEWVETTGKSLEEAKDAALDQLGVDEDDAEFEVLEEPRSGLFGRVRGEARVRARVAPRTQRPKQERRRKSAGAAPADQAAPAKAAAKKAPAKKAAAKAAPAKRAPKAAPVDEDAAPTPTPDPAPPAAEAPAPKPARAPRAAGATRKSAPAEEGNATMEDAVTVEAQAEIMEEFLVGLLDAFGVSGEVTWEKVDEDTVEIDVTGDDLGLLIGPKGQTLQAVQDLARTVVQRKAAGHHEGRVRVDVGGYRQRRREALARFATQVAEQVAASG